MTALKIHWPEGAVFGDARDFSVAVKKRNAKQKKILMQLQTSQTAPLASLRGTQICKNAKANYNKESVSKLGSHL